MRSILLILLLLCQSLAFAGDDTEAVYQVSGLSIAQGKVAMDLYHPERFARKGESRHYYYELDQQHLTLVPLIEAKYRTAYSGDETKARFDFAFGDGPSELTSSSGEMFQTEYTDCESQGEGGQVCKGHFLIHKGKRYKLDVQKPCGEYSCSVLLVEKWDNQIWIGFGSLGEYGWYPGGVQVIDASSAKIIFQSDHGIATVIRRDKQSGATWIGLEGGFTIVDGSFKTSKSYFFYVDFDSVTGLAQVKFSPEHKKDNPFAKLALTLQLPESKAKEFYNIVKSIPKEAQDELEKSNYQDQFLPASLNILTPFVLSATESENTSIREEATYALCRLSDSRAAEYFARMQRTLPTDKDRSGNYIINHCFKTYAKAGLIPARAVNEIKPVLLESIRSSLTCIRAEAVMKHSPNCQIAGLLDAVSSLHALGDPSGLNMLNLFLKNSQETYGVRSIYEMSKYNEGFPTSNLFPEVLLPSRFRNLNEIENGTQLSAENKQLFSTEKELLDRAENEMKQNQSVQPKTALNGAIQNALKIKEHGNESGITFLEYFISSGRHSSLLVAALYSELLNGYKGNKEIAEVVVTGLEHFDIYLTSQIKGGCEFFNMRSTPLIQKLYDSRYADAIMIAIERIESREDDVSDAPCIEALRSQLDDPATREGFKETYPFLSEKGKIIVDSLLDPTKPRKLDDYGLCYLWKRADGVGPWNLFGTSYDHAPKVYKQHSFPLVPTNPYSGPLPDSGFWKYFNVVTTTEAHIVAKIGFRVPRPTVTNGIAGLDICQKILRIFNEKSANASKLEELFPNQYPL